MSRSRAQLESDLRVYADHLSRALEEIDRLRVIVLSLEAEKHAWAQTLRPAALPPVSLYHLPIEDDES